jgi:hypothetical protein
MTMEAHIHILTIHTFHRHRKIHNTDIASNSNLEYGAGFEYISTGEEGEPYIDYTHTYNERESNIKRTWLRQRQRQTQTQRECERVREIEIEQ